MQALQENLEQEAKLTRG